MYEDKETWGDSPRTTGLVLLAVLLSPLGGPMLFTLTFVVCPGTQGLEYHCFIPDAVGYYIGAMAMIPMAFLGDYGAAWLVVSFVAVVTTAWFFVRATWEWLCGL